MAQSTHFPNLELQLRLPSCRQNTLPPSVEVFSNKALKIFSIRSSRAYLPPTVKCQNKVSKTTSLQHLNIGGTFITDESLYAIANNCPHLKSVILWSCRHVTERGLFMIVNKCRKLESINVWGMRVPVDCFSGLLSISPALQIKPITLNRNMGGIMHVA